jgi:mono/diheme cytochrome c family protein
MKRIPRKTILLGVTTIGLTVIVALAAALGLVIGQEQQLTNPKPSTPESIAAGKAAFFEYCSGCHGRRADGRGLQSLNLNPKPQNLRNAQFVKYLTDDRLFTSISGGVRGTAMPAFELMLASEKRWDAINYIRSLTADDTLKFANSTGHQAVAVEIKNPVTVTEAAIADGKNVFMNYCASCHGAKADGKGKSAASLVPAPRNLIVVTSWGEKPFIDYLSDARLYDSITNGVPGTSMLPWIGPLNDEQRWNAILYLRTEADKNREKGEVSFGNQ